MTTELGILSGRIGAMEDEELLDILEHGGNYTPATLRLAEQEADRRGGRGPLRDRVASARNDAAVDVRHREGAERRLAGMRRMLRWTIPSMDRFRRYPELRIVVACLRLLTLVAALFALANLIGAPIALLSGSSFHWVFFTTVTGMVYTLLALLALLAVQGVIMLLVDTEHSARTACSILGQLSAKGGTKPAPADSASTEQEE